MSKVLITGGTGFIGSRLAYQHLASNDQVSVFAQIADERQQRTSNALARAGIDVIEGSILDAAALAVAMRKVDIVYHLAAAQHETGQDLAYFQDVNVTGTKNVLEQAVASGVSTMVHGSTIGVYGAPPNGTEINEETATEPDNYYGETKLAGEQLALSYAGQLKTVVARISETYGPGDYRLLKLFRAINKARFPTIGAGDNVHQPIFIDDLTTGLRSTSERGRSGEIYLLGGNEHLSTNEMIELVRYAVSAKRAGFRLPLGPLAITARLLESTFPRIGLSPPLTTRRLDFFVKTLVMDCSKATRDLGFFPRTRFSIGTLVTAAWYRSHGLL